MHEITKDLEKSAVSLTLAESLQNSAKSYGLVTLTILAIISVGFVILGFIMLPQKILLGATCIAFFGFGALIFYI